MLSTPVPARIHPVRSLAAWLPWTPIALALLCFVYGVIVSWHWPVVHDASVMHYVVFLTDHGMVPYRNIVDINMPGAFLTEWLAIHLLGPGDLAWRIFDLLEMVAAVAASSVLSRRVDWRAGALGGLLLCIVHMANGAIEAGQRDWTVAVLLLAGGSFFSLALARRQAAWMAAFALACGVAATIKPVAAVLLVALLLLALLQLRRGGVDRGPFLAWAAAGVLAATAVFFGFLGAYHATSAWLVMMRGLLPFYAGIGNVPFALLAKLALGRYLAALLGAAIVMSFCWRLLPGLEQQIFLLGMLSGAALYFAQRKGYSYHRLTLLGFVLLYLCATAYAGMRSERAGARWAGAALVILLLAYSVPRWTLATHRESFDRSMQVALEGDLNRLGGGALSGKVQCLEMGAGCITDLYCMRLMQSTGFISDFFLFTPEPGPAIQKLRTRLLQELMEKPPQVVVLVPSDWAGGAIHYQPTEDWPSFAAWLSAHYQLEAERRAADGTIDRGSYRVYVLR